jgi:hypothetical protein
MKWERLGWSAVSKTCVAALLLWAIGRHPYGYYKLLRWVVCGTGGFTAWEAANSGKDGWAITFGIVALVFNPVLPVGLDRATWAWVDLAVAILFVTSITAIRRRISGQ